MKPFNRGDESRHQPPHAPLRWTCYAALPRVAVLMYHARDTLWCGTSYLFSHVGFRASFNALLGYVLSIFSFGWLGVPLFFVLSGYCIHRSYARCLAADAAAPICLKDYAR